MESDGFLVDHKVDVPEHLLERSRVRREKLAGQQIVNPASSFLDSETAAFLADQANGGICAIAVANVVVGLEKADPTEVVSEYFDPHSGELRPNMKTIQRMKGFRALAGVTTPEEVPQNQAEFVPGMDRKGALSEVVDVLHGIDFQLGFFKGDFGVLTYVEDKTSFVPLVSFVDKRDAPEEDGVCSYATIRHSLIPCEVQTKEDEKLPIGEFDKTTGEIRVAKHVLDQITVLQETILNGDSEANAQAAGTLFAYLNVLDVIANVYHFDTEKDYTKELFLRKIISANKGAAALLHQELKESDLGDAADWLESIRYENVDEQKIKLGVSYPNARDKTERVLAVITVGERLGQMSVHKAAELDGYSDEQIVEKIVARLIGREQERPFTKELRTTFTNLGLDADMLLAYGKLQQSLNAAEELIAHTWTILTTQQRTVATMMAAEIAERYSLNVGDFKIKHIGVAYNPGLVFEGEFPKDQLKKLERDLDNRLVFRVQGYAFDLDEELGKTEKMLNDAERMAVRISRKQLKRAQKLDQSIMARSTGRFDTTTWTPLRSYSY